MKEHRTYSAALKRDLARRMSEPEMNVMHLSQQTGVPRGRLYAWYHLYQQWGDAAFEGRVTSRRRLPLVMQLGPEPAKTHQEELAEATTLCGHQARRIAQLEQENQLLKKACVLLRSKSDSK